MEDEKVLVLAKMHFQKILVDTNLLLQYAKLKDYSLIDAIKHVLRKVEIINEKIGKESGKNGESSMG